MTWSLRWRLSVMMILQYAIWGAWAPILVLHLQTLDSFKHASEIAIVGNVGVDTKINLIYMTMAIASMLSPFVAGQIADRYFATQRFLALSHFLGGFLLFVVAQVEGFGAVFWFMLLYSIVYAPTVALTNSLSFHHLPDGEKDFASIRMCGTIGWVGIMWLFSAWLGLADGLIGNISPEWQQTLVDWRASLEHPPLVKHCLYVAGGISIIMGFFCFMLPHTPPPEKPSSPWAFLEALQLMRHRSFAILVVVAFLISTELQFYYVLTPAFFNQGGGPFAEAAIADVLRAEGNGEGAEQTAAAMIERGDRNGDKQLSRTELQALADDDANARRMLDAQDAAVAEKGGLELDAAWVGPVMTLGQICEMIVMFLLPLCLLKFGFRATITFGILAWSVRYFVFSLGDPASLVIASQTLHGFGFAFYFVGAYIYADTIAPKDIKASTQSFLVFVMMGAGMFVSSLFAGLVSDYFARNWHLVFLVPAMITLVGAGLFVTVFRPEKRPENSEAASSEAG